MLDDWSIRQANIKSLVFINVKARRANGLEDTFTGTGIVVHPDGYVLTCNHVIPKKGSDYVQVDQIGSVGARAGTSYTLEVVRRDEQADLMLLQLPPDTGPWRSLERRALAKPGSEIVALGFPLQLGVTHAPGAITNTDKGLFVTDVGVNPGMSGGPVFDRSGALIGIVAGGYEAKAPINLVIPLSFGTDLLRVVNSPLLNPNAATPTPTPPKQEPKTGGISIWTIQTMLRDADGGQDADRLARAMVRDAQQLATDRLPITGSADTTKTIKLSYVNQLFMQSSESVVKVQMFPLTTGARQVRGLSLRRFDDGKSEHFVADSWAFVLRGDEIIQCEQVGEENFASWQIPQISIAAAPGGHEPLFVLIAFYRNIHFFENRADSITLALNDVAGTIESVNLTVVGYFKKFRFTKYFEFGSDLRFYEIESSRLDRQQLKLAERLQSFDKVLRAFESKYVDAKTGEERKPADEVINIWQFCSTLPIKGDAVSIQGVSENLEIFVSGILGP